MKYVYLVIFIGLLDISVFARLQGAKIEVHDPKNSKVTVNESIFLNQVDHFDPTNFKTYEQRYWYTLDFWDERKGPIFLYLCGESIGHFPGDDTLIMQMAKKFNGVVVALEHRYYGYSLPTLDLSLENLKYLSQDQGLADAANFLKFFQRKITAGTSKVFVVGGSYAGALSAWMRYKYPHLVAGSLSSSGVVNAILDFKEFDNQIKIAVNKSGPECEAIIHKLLDEAKSLWEKDPWILKKIHNAPYFEWEDFEFYYADLFAETVQYGARTKLCKLMKEIENDENRQYKLARLAIDNRAAPHTYGFQYIRTIQADPYNEFRQWTYQYCSALGYLNTISSTENPMRFKDMDLNYWKRYCAKAFDVVIFPDTFHTNSLYGDTRIVDVVDHVIFTNAGEDPWQWAGVRR